MYKVEVTLNWQKTFSFPESKTFFTLIKSYCWKHNAMPNPYSAFIQWVCFTGVRGWFCLSAWKPLRCERGSTWNNKVQLRSNNTFGWRALHRIQGEDNDVLKYLCGKMACMFVFGIVQSTACPLVNFLKQKLLQWESGVFQKNIVVLHCFVLMFTDIYICATHQRMQTKTAALFSNVCNYFIGILYPFQEFSPHSANNRPQYCI